MASSVHRREVISWMGIGALVPLLGACSAMPGQSSGSASLDLLYVADTLDARQPGLPVVPATRLGPVSHLGRAPWMTGSSAGLAHPQLAPLLDASQGGSRLGGYAVLAALLEQLRGEAGAGNSLTLENGQGWNGSGLAYLTQGESGVQGSRMLGSEVRVSSDERVLWPQRSQALYRQASAASLGAGLDEAQRNALGLEAVQYFERGGARIAVIGITDPYAQDQKASLKQWYQSLLPTFEQARRKADLVVALADVGTGPGLWLAERVPEIDVVLCARGQDLWPAPVEATQASGRRVPVLFAGCRGSGAFRLRCQQVAGQWQFEGRFYPAFEQQLSPIARQRASQLQAELRQQRAGHAAWLDQPLARAPHALWRRDTLGGSWDRLLHQALADDSSMPVLLPGLRYDYPLAAGEPITREHLIALTGGYPAPVVEAPARQVEQVLENAAEQLFGDPLLLDNSQDLPRWQGQPWRVSYSPQGKRITGLNEVQGLCRTFGLQFEAQAGEPLWQRVEAWLGRQPTGWQLAQLQLPEVRYVQGHPGWHPRQVAS
ncbi:lipoprotein UxpA [Pseudomonas sp. PSKL.D1]|uniref:lipoprotein UxpA n=1 Tax=Pseudomonas sp. PSKL.D1 TaxID=3029060 RepID=UPI0023813711|nr:lipoprotein UxpA [Pseudomonas sp. PSKL.D1]WDY57019.1 lipoprotein UxpA [Pseudomonas sp. PSKL.D1]